jgi:hypothetical protein
MSKIDEIKKIKTLLDDGVINQEEFITLKGKILEGSEINQNDSHFVDENTKSSSSSSNRVNSKNNSSPMEEINEKFKNDKKLKKVLLTVGIVSIIWGVITLWLSAEHNIKREGLGEGLKHTLRDNPFKLVGAALGGIAGSAAGPEGTLAGAGIGSSLGSIFDHTSDVAN